MEATRTCKIDGCEQSSVIRRGFCSTHYSRWRLTGDAGAAAVILNGKQGCSIADCDRPHSGLGYCHLHWQRLKRYGDPLHVPAWKPRPLALGPESPKWKGDDAGYPAIHCRVKRERGRASSHVCEHCGKPAKHWAYDHQDPEERSSPEGPYSLDPARYVPLCVGCHNRLDRAHSMTRSEST